MMNRDPNIIPIGAASKRIARRFGIIDGGKADMIDTSSSTMEQLQASAAHLTRQQMHMDAKKLAVLVGIHPTIEFMQAIIKDLADGVQP